MSRSRSWRAISTAASRLFLKTVSSRLDRPTFLPVFTSMTVSASVCSMMSDPPEGSHTLRSSARWSCSCTWWRSKSGRPLGLGVEVLDPVGQLGADRRHVVAHRGEQVAVVDQHAAVVLAELLADDPHGHVGLAVEQGRRLGPLGQGLDLRPLVEQAADVVLDLLGGHVLGRGAHDHAVLGGLDPVEDLPQALALVVGQPLGDAVGRRVGDEHDEPAGQRHLLGEAGALGADGVLRDLAEDGLPGLQHVLDAGAGPCRALDVLGVVVHVAPVQDGVLGRCRCRRTPPPCPAGRSAPGRGRRCRGSASRRRTAATRSARSASGPRARRSAWPWA